MATTPTTDTTPSKSTTTGTTSNINTAVTTGSNNALSLSDFQGGYTFRVKIGGTPKIIGNGSITPTVSTTNPTSTPQQALQAVATKIGMSDKTLAALISLETNGTFNPSYKSTDGKLLGLLQFNAASQAKYGVVSGQSFQDQMNAVGSYLVDNGYKAGMSLQEIYSIVATGKSNATAATISATTGTSLTASVAQLQGGTAATNATKFLQGTAFSSLTGQSSTTATSASTTGSLTNLGASTGIKLKVADAADIASFASNNAALVAALEHPVTGTTVDTSTLTELVDPNLAGTEQCYIFERAKGDFLGSPYVRLSKRYKNFARFVLHDPDDDIRQKIKACQNVEVEIGLTGGEAVNKFVGVIWWIGRELPHGTVVEACEAAAKLDTPMQEPVSQDSSTTTSTDNTELINKLATGNLTGLSFFTTPVPANLFTTTANTTFTKLPTGVISFTKDTSSVAPIPTSSTPIPASTSTVSISFTPLANLAVFSQINTQQAGKAAIGDTIFNSALNSKPLNYKNITFKNKSNIQLGKPGTNAFNVTQMQQLVKTATLQGDHINVIGNKVMQVTPGNEPATSVTLDYITNRSAFIGQPTIKKPTADAIAGAFGVVTVTGWDSKNSQTVGASVATQAPDPTHPTGTINVPGWGNAILSQAIITGSVYTWADATKNGSRVPTKDIMQGIADICQAIQPLTDKTVGKGKKWEIKSWYRDPAAQRECGSTAPRHPSGKATDCAFSGFQALSNSLWNSWSGGMGCDPSGGYVHLDTYSSGRWHYVGGKAV